MAELDLLDGIEDPTPGIKPAEIPVKSEAPAPKKAEPKVEVKKEVEPPASPPEKAKKSIRDTINEARDEVSKGRDASGKFVKADKPVENKEIPAAKAAAAPELASTETKTEAPKSTFKAPVGWTKEAKAEFDKLPDVVKASIQKREDEVSKGFAGTKERTQRLDLYDQLVDKYVPDVNTMGTKEQVVERVLAWFGVMRHQNKPFAANQLMRLVHEYGLTDELRKIIAPATQQQTATGQSNQTTPPQTNDPRVDQLSKEMRAMQEKANQQAYTAAKTVVDTWSADKEHFNAVRDQMFQLFEKGFVKLGDDQALTKEVLDQAYDMAVRMNPEIQQQVIDAEIAKKQAEVEAKLKDERKAAQVANARNANQSLKPQPPILPSKTAQPPGRKMSVREAINAAMREAGR